MIILFEVLNQFCRLRLGTVNALDLKKNGSTAPLLYTENDIIVDPLIVLRCDKRVFRYEFL